MQMELRFRESDIDCWATRYTAYQHNENREREAQLLGWRETILRHGHLGQWELYTVACWMLYEHGTDAAEPTRNNADAHIMIATRQAFASQDDWEKLLYLTQLEGVGQSVASAILHLYDESPYPILSSRALWSVGFERRQRREHPFWPEYIALCREIADRNGIDMRTLDRALWRYSYDGGHC